MNDKQYKLLEKLAIIAVVLLALDILIMTIAVFRLVGKLH